MKGIPSFYNAAWIAASPVLLPLFLAARKATGKDYPGLRERLAMFPPSDSPKQSTIWCHAISVGELNALFPVVCALRNYTSSYPLVITTQTAAGMETARQRFSFAHAILYAPLDHPWFVRRFIRRFRPSALLVMETGYWPNMLYQARSHGSFIVLAQGRMSEGSFRWWTRFPALARWIFDCFHCITLENAPMHERFVAMGAHADRIRTLPNTKYDTVRVVPEDERALLRQRLGLEQGDLVLVAGSTHPGEERELAKAYKELRAEHPRSILILAPRRLERLEQVSREMTELEMPLRYWTRVQPGSHRSGVVIIDTMGDLAKLYAIATVAFVGKSLFLPGGGHSLLEPAAQGVPVLHGPYIENAADMAAHLRSLGAALTVHAAADIVDQIKRILGAPDDVSAAVRRAQQWIETQRGASSVLAELLLRGLGSPAFASLNTESHR